MLFFHQLGVASQLYKVRVVLNIRGASDSAWLSDRLLCKPVARHQRFT